MVVKVPGRDILVVGEALRDEIARVWNVDNTDGILPRFYFIQDAKRFRVSGQDIVVVTNLEEFPTDTSIGARYENALYTGNIGIITKRSYVAGVKMKEELRRVLMAIRFSPFTTSAPDLTGSPWIKVRRFTDQAHRTKRLGRWNCDFEIHHVGRSASPDEEAAS